MRDRRPIESGEKGMAGLSLKGLSVAQKRKVKALIEEEKKSIEAIEEMSLRAAYDKLDNLRERLYFSLTL